MTVPADVYWRKKKLNFDQARQIALAMESDDKNFHGVAACSNTTTLTQPNISRIDRGNSDWGKSEKLCFRCDGKHLPDYCRFRDAICNFCQKTGYISTACLERKGTKGTRNRRTYKVDRDDTHSFTSGDTASVRKLFRISRKKIDPLMVLVGINDRCVEMEIDTRATVSLVSHIVFDGHWQGPNKPKLSHKAQKLVTYTGENIHSCEVTVIYDN